MKHIYAHSDPKHALQQFISGWIQIAQALVVVLSLGFILPSWDFAYTMWLIDTDRTNHKARGDRK